MSGAPVLYVEDEEADAFFMQLAFQEMGVANSVIILKDGQQAVDYLSGKGAFADRNQHPLPCLLLLDLNLPLMSGFEVLEWIRRQSSLKALPVVIFSASSLEVDLEHAIKAGADGYVVKPNDLTQIPKLLEPLRARWIESIE